MTGEIRNLVTHIFLKAIDPKEDFEDIILLSNLPQEIEEKNNNRYSPHQEAPPGREPPGLRFANTWQSACLPEGATFARDEGRGFPHCSIPQNSTLSVHSHHSNAC